MFSGITYEVAEAVATLTLNRPEVSNGFNVPICEEILAAIELATADDSVNILLIKGAGKVFSVGGDLAEMQRAVDDDDVSSLVKIAELVNTISFAIKRLPKPVIMAVDGPVAGAAFNMVIAADFCIATDKAKFIQAFVNVNLAPDAGGIFLLTRSLGINRATQLAMTAEAVSAEKALAYGFVYKTCESDKLDKTVAGLITKLKRASFQSYAAIKQMIWASEFAGWEGYAKLELDLQSQLAYKDDFKEGVRAYTEKRRPQFTGK